MKQRFILSPFTVQEYLTCDTETLNIEEEIFYSSERVNRLPVSSGFDSTAANSESPTLS